MANAGMARIREINATIPAVFMNSPSLELGNGIAIPKPLGLFYVVRDRIPLHARQSIVISTANPEPDTLTDAQSNSFAMTSQILSVPDTQHNLSE
jgi:hypothetical protein